MPRSEFVPFDPAQHLAEYEGQLEHDIQVAASEASTKLTVFTQNAVLYRYA